MTGAPALVASPSAEDGGRRIRALAPGLAFVIAVSGVAHPHDLAYLLCIPLERLLQLEISARPVQRIAQGAFSLDGSAPLRATGGGRDAL